MKPGCRLRPGSAPARCHKPSRLQQRAELQCHCVERSAPPPAWDRIPCGIWAGRSAPAHPWCGHGTNCPAQPGPSSPARRWRAQPPAAANILVDSVYIQDFKGENIFSGGSAVTGTVIQNSTMTNFNGDGISMLAADLQVLNNTISNGSNA